MTAPLPSSGPEREIMIRALARFSDDCQPPELTSDCPFFQRTADGGVCGEQCKDILASVGGDRPPVEVTLALGDLELHRRRRPRPRRGPDKTNRPFDAREAFLGDRERPRDVRSVVSLIHEVRALLSVPPPVAPDLEEHRYEVRASFDELTRRGVDAEAIVRHGLLDQFSLGIAMTASWRLFRAEKDQDGTSLTGEAWNSLLVASYEADRQLERHSLRDFDGLMRRLRNLSGSTEVLPPLDAPALGKAAERTEVDEDIVAYALGGRFVNRVATWVQTADLEDVLGWRAPSAGRFTMETLQVGPSPAEVEHGRWLFDRFSKTYLTDWQESSLQHEWRWLHGRCEGAAPAAVMKERPTRAEEVSACLADVACAAAPSAPAVPESPDSVALFRFVRLAARSLKEGRRQEAVALYRGLVQLRPDDPDINNNYGFCLLVDDPRAALRWLERAAVLSGSGIDGTNLANRVYAATVLNDDELVLLLADRLFVASATLHFQSAYLWETGHDGPTLGENVDPVTYAGGLALAAAERLQRPVQVTLWTDRLASHA